MENILEERSQSIQATRRLASNRGQHELDVGVAVQAAEYVRLDTEQFVVKLLLWGGEWNIDRFWFSNGECADVAPARPVDKPRKGVQCLHVGDELDSVIGCYAILGKLIFDPVKFRIGPEHRLSPRSCGGLVKSLGCLRCPIRYLGTRMVDRLVDKRIGGCDMLKALLVQESKSGRNALSSTNRSWSPSWIGVAVRKTAASAWSQKNRTAWCA